MAVLRFGPNRLTSLGRAGFGAAAALVAAALLPSAAAGQSMTQEEALALAFPDADSITRKTAYLSEEQLDRIARASDPEDRPPSGIVTYYVAFKASRPRGVAYFDAHRVRTLDQVLMIVVEPGGRVGRIETVRFREPPEYRAPDGWLSLFRNRVLGPEISLKREIPNITGATLTAGAVTRAVRRVLALHGEIEPFSGDPMAAAPGGRTGRLP